MENVASFFLGKYDGLSILLGTAWYDDEDSTSRAGRAIVVGVDDMNRGKGGEV